MFFNSKAVAFTLAVCISVVTTSFLSLIGEVPVIALFTTALLSFACSYLLIYITLEFLVFKEINKVYDDLEQLKKKDLLFLESATSKAQNPLQKLNEEFFAYALLKQREIDELKRMETFRREFLADVSHELKTPIFAAQGFVHTLLDGAMEDETVRQKFLEKAAKSLDGLDLLVQDLLTLSQMEAGEIKMHLETFDIKKLTKEVFEQLEDKAARKKIQLGFLPGTEKEIWVYADPQRIYQVLINLVSNGVKYNIEGGKVEVGFMNKNDQLEISVKDTGVGISEDHLKRIFERFYRVDKSRSKENGGTGLGLAIVKHILEGHHSQIEVASRPGVGSTFSFFLQKGKKIDKLKSIELS
jgi:two-component system, OmpR family, phosphate regulon sensor histidine kinase PhoR